MKEIRNNPSLPVLFGVVACSWMPHWSCHYYRLETQSSFIVGDLHFSFLDSWLSLLLYSSLIVLNLLSISNIKSRFAALLVSGVLHVLLGLIHIIRLIYPFHFEVFGYEWSKWASIREILIVVPFGGVCVVMSLLIKSRHKTN